MVPLRTWSSVRERCQRSRGLPSSPSFSNRAPLDLWLVLRLFATCATPRRSLANCRARRRSPPSRRACSTRPPRRGFSADKVQRHAVHLASSARQCVPVQTYQRRQRRTDRHRTPSPPLGVGLIGRQVLRGRQRRPAPLRALWRRRRAPRCLSATPSGPLRAPPGQPGRPGAAPARRVSIREVYSVATVTHLAAARPRDAERVPLLARSRLVFPTLRAPLVPQGQTLISAGEAVVQRLADPEPQVVTGRGSLPGRRWRRAPRGSSPARADRQRSTWRRRVRGWFVTAEHLAALADRAIVQLVQLVDGRQPRPPAL